MVRGEEDSHAADADKDAGNLGGMIADVEEEKGYNDDNDDSPEVYKLRGEYGCLFNYYYWMNC